MMNSEEWKAYNKLYTGDETASYAIYSVAAFADPSFGGVPVYNQAILDEVNEGKVPATVDEFLTYCEAAGSAGYVGWWPRNDKLTNWNEIDATLALPQGTSITVPKGAGTGHHPLRRGRHGQRILDRERRLRAEQGRRQAAG